VCQDHGGIKEKKKKRKKRRNEKKTREGAKQPTYSPPSLSSCLSILSISPVSFTRSWMRKGEEKNPPKKTHELIEGEQEEEDWGIGS
jgi:hypothetical protein